MKQLQRLVIRQGNGCFFCGYQIPQREASVEHLDARSSGGEKTDQNCVACCRAINAALGNLTIKEKRRVILNQPSSFPCPHHAQTEDVATNATPTTIDLAEKTRDIRRRLKYKVPRRKSTLFNTIRVEVPDVTEELLNALFEHLVATGEVSKSGARLRYLVLEGEA